MHEVKIHDVCLWWYLAQDSQEMTLVFISVHWLKTRQIYGTKGLLCMMGIEMKHSSCVQCYFVPLMTFQHMGIWVDTVLRDIVYALSMKKTQVMYNWNMKEK